MPAEPEPRGEEMITGTYGENWVWAWGLRMDTKLLSNVLFECLKLCTVFNPTNCKSVLNNHLLRMSFLHVWTSTSSSSGSYVQ